MIVASVTYGYSDYNDILWSWLNKHSDMFENEEHDLNERYDYWRAWGMMSLAGCNVEGYGVTDAPEEYACDWGEGVRISFDGDVGELIRRLDSFIAHAPMKMLWESDAEK